MLDSLSGGDTIVAKPTRFPCMTGRPRTVNEGNVTDKRGSVESPAGADFQVGKNRLIPQPITGTDRVASQERAGLHGFPSRRLYYL